MISLVAWGRLSDYHAERPHKTGVLEIKPTLKPPSRLRPRGAALLSVGARAKELKGTAPSPDTRVGKAKGSKYFRYAIKQKNVATAHLT